MSDYTIRLRPADLRQRADEIERNANIVRKEVETIETEVTSLKPTFMGTTATKFLTEFGNARSEMEQWDDIVKQFADLLRVAANNLEKADRQGS